MPSPNRFLKNTLVMALLHTLTCFAQGHDSIQRSKAEAQVSCPEVHAQVQLKPYEFAKATLISLWYARNAAERSKELMRVPSEPDNPFAFVTALMRITKTATNDFICAKRAVQPFGTSKASGDLQAAAGFLVLAYDAHISINQRMIELLKNLSSRDSSDMADRVSTLQVEREQRWSDLVRPTSFALLLLTNMEGISDNQPATRLVITKKQKGLLVDWANDHFSEFKDGTPKEQWSSPSRTAEMYFEFLNGRRCADE